MTKGPVSASVERDTAGLLQATLLQTDPRQAGPLHTGRLLLTPEDALAAVAHADLAAALTTAGLLGPALPGGTAAFTAYAPGVAFVHLIGFSGCAVQLPTDPAGGGPTLHLRLEGPYPRPLLKAGRNSRAPRCPVCGRLLHDWRDQATAWSPPPDGPDPLLACADCGAIRPGWDWQWRQQAGFGRVFVSCEEVFPGEGQPMPRLMTLLATLGIGPWRHFYVQD